MLSRKKIPQLTLMAGALAVLLGAYFPACETQVSVTPTTCDPFAGCTPAGGSPAADAESRLSSAQVPSLISLGLSNWSALEPCVPCAKSDCSDLAAPPAGVTKAAVHAGCVFGTTQTTCQCYYNLTGLQSYVNTYVVPTSSRNGRNLLLQLAPIFTNNRVVPAYLVNQPFGGSGSAMLTAYEHLWDAVQTSVLDPLYAQGSGPAILVSIGNEINGYLDDPCPNGGSCPETSKTVAWPNYFSFFQAAKAYIAGKFSHSIETVTMTWKDLPGSYGLQQAAICNSQPCAYTALEMLQMYQNADIIAATYYPDSSLAGDALAWTLLGDLANMQTLGTSLNNKGVVLQEAGFSSAIRPGDGEAAQNAFVSNLVAVPGSAQLSHIGAINFHQLYDFSQKTAPGFGSCSTTADCQVGAWAAGLKQSAFTCSSQHTCNVVAASDSCTTDAQCVSQVGPGAFCCTSGQTLCNYATKNRCVFPSACDLVSSVPLTGSSCPSGLVRTSAGCADPTFRTAACSWGLLRSDGTAKPAWSTFQAALGR